MTATPEGLRRNSTESQSWRAVHSPRPAAASPLGSQLPGHGIVDSGAGVGNLEDELAGLAPDAHDGRLGAVDEGIGRDLVDGEDDVRDPAHRDPGLPGVALDKLPQRGEPLGLDRGARPRGSRSAPGAASLRAPQKSRGSA